MRTVYKYRFNINDLLMEYRPLEWTAMSKVVHGKYDNNTQDVTLWIEHHGHVDDDNQRQFKFQNCYLKAVGTGWEIPNGMQHLYTVITEVGFVWHIYKTHNIVEGS